MSEITSLSAPSLRETSPPSQILEDVELEGEPAQAIIDFILATGGVSTIIASLILFTASGLSLRSTAIIPLVILGIGLCMFGAYYVRRRRRELAMRRQREILSPLEVRSMGKLAPFNAFEVTIQQRARKTVAIERIEFTLMLLEQRAGHVTDAEGAMYFAEDIRLWAESGEVFLNMTIPADELLNAKTKFIMPDTPALLHKADIDFSLKEAEHREKQEKRWFPHSPIKYFYRNIDWRLQIMIRFTEGSIHTRACLLQKVRHQSFAKS